MSTTIKLDEKISCIESHKILKITYQRKSYCLKVTQIIYIESYNRHIFFHTQNKKFECIGKLNEYEESLLLYGFLRCHQGFLVNMHYISSIENNYIKLKTGETIEMSVRKKQACLKSFNKYIEKFTI